MTYTSFVGGITGWIYIRTNFCTDYFISLILVTLVAYTKSYMYISTSAKIVNIMKLFYTLPKFSQLWKLYLEVVGLRKPAAYRFSLIQ